MSQFYLDFANAMDTYLDDEVTISVHSTGPINGSSLINTNEVCMFTVKIANNGPLDMTNLVLHILGKNGTKVGLLPFPEPTADDMTVPPIGFNTVGAQTTEETGPYYFKAPSEAKASGTDLVNAHLSEWNGSLTYLLNTRSTVDHTNTPAGVYEAQVFSLLD
jgi:hypothetical protein